MKCSKGYKIKQGRCVKTKSGQISSDNFSSDNYVSTGTGFTGLLTLLFIGLKLTHYINWSWWWVLSPLWIGFVLGIIIFLIFLIIIKIFDY